MAFATINQSPTIPVIEEAFSADPSLKKRVYDTIATIPQCQPLFEDIAKYTSNLQLAHQAQTTNPALRPADAHPPQTANNEGPAAKKRKLQNGDTTSTGDTGDTDLDAEKNLQFSMPDVSFAIPQRKKLTLEITAGGRGYLRARNQNTREIEFGVPIDCIQHVLCLPVPEKTQRQFNFCIIPQNADGVNTPPAGGSAFEAMVCTVPDGPPKAAYNGSGQQIGMQEGETAEKLVRGILEENLASASGGRVRVVRPDEREFVSAVPEARRKGEKAFHVKAFRGSKEGYLFFLSTGILFGFKKPLMFFAFENIESTSYTSVLQRTFNLNIAARANGSDEIQEFELSMIDQADYAGIDGYIKGHGLQDASLAEARRAKRYNVNGGKGEKMEEVKAETETGEESELQKANREIEDQEDEEEEDYDPGSEGESEGSGSSSEESQGEEDGNGEDEELGSDEDEEIKEEGD